MYWKKLLFVGEKIRKKKGLISISCLLSWLVVVLFFSFFFCIDS